MGSRGEAHVAVKERTRHFLGVGGLSVAGAVQRHAPLGVKMFY